jgi:hypothetical protein
MQLRRGAVLAFVTLVVGLACNGHAWSTPQYAARAGRTCDNCHVSPNRWVDPPLASRKCTLSCQGCHVDPAGGGMRTVSGRFYGRATLPIIATSPRPTADWDRNLAGRRDRATSYNSNIPYGPSTQADARAYNDSIADRWAWGAPPGETRYGPFQGRFGSLRADPVLRIGGDFRVATLLSQSALIFPMQADIATMLHPLHHLTVLANVGARGQSSGYADTFDDSHTPYLRELMVTLHEFPFQAYAKAGRFVPSCGLRLDDHTSRTRREFELDGSLPDARVTGVEIGAAPNYPFVQASYFKLKSKYVEPDPWDILDHDAGWGTAINAGIRELGWSIGGSAMSRHRPLDEGGDARTYGVYGVFNPWFYRRNLPVTVQAELDWGTYQRRSGREAKHLVWYGEVDYALANGVNLLLACDWADPDRDVFDDHSGRYQLGAQVTPYPGVTLDGRLRVLQVATSTGSGADFFFQIHFWF